MPINTENIKAWVMETIRSLGEALKFGWKNITTEDKRVFPQIEEIELRPQEFLVSTPTIFETTSTVITPMQPLRTETAVSAPEAPAPEQLKATRNIRRLLEELSNRGSFMTDNLDDSVVIWKPILAFYFEPTFERAIEPAKRQIPSWHYLATWQYEHYDRIMNTEQIVDTLLQQFTERGYMKKRGVPYNREDIKAYFYSKLFDKLLKMSNDLKLALPEPTTVQDIQNNPYLKQRTAQYLQYLMRGYKLRGIDPHPFVKQAFSLISKESSVGFLFEEELKEIREMVEETLVKQEQTQSK